ncbi:MAG TPA: caspase family protein [Accumulibacter sp.]|uniref:caspase family protein n=1 Tax=Accumulibacter sp. TaxID=2053492 RepID=UPI002B5881A8|nr:caspase family protein [Accumulibacter sp.]HRD90770.1 caspase family protein [Accumulibacter sp.]
MGLIPLLLALALILPGEALAAGQRIALVIGNSDYPVRKLLNPVNDASDVATLLVTKLGFARDDVIVERDTNAEGQRRALARFEQKLKTAPGAVGFFYFAGHGAQIAGRNYLLPAKNAIRSGEDAKALGLRVTDVLDAMRDGGASLMIVVLDACRDDPFPGGSRGSRGLQRENPPNGSLIAYAAAAEGTADDDERQRNGVYTRFLLRRLVEPGLTLEQVFKRVRGDVRQATNGRQEPEVLLALEGEQDFYFLGVTPDPRADEESFWLQARQLGSSEAYESYLAKYPRGRYGTPTK